jgi:hypothetical protein
MRFAIEELGIACPQAEIVDQPWPLLMVPDQISAMPVAAWAQPSHAPVV